MDIHTLKSSDIIRVLPLIEEEYKEFRLRRPDRILDPTKRFDLASLKAYCESPDHLCYGVELSGQLVAFCLSRIEKPSNPRLLGNKPSLILEDLYVVPSFRKKRIGETLVRSLLTKADETGCREFKLDIRKENEGAMAFCKAIGLIPLSYSFGMEM